MIVFFAAGLVALCGLVVIADVVLGERRDRKAAGWDEFLTGHPFVGEAATPELQVLRMDPGAALDAELRAVRWEQL